MSVKIASLFSDIYKATPQDSALYKFFLFKPGPPEYTVFAGVNDNIVSVDFSGKLYYSIERTVYEYGPGSRQAPIAKHDGQTLGINVTALLTPELMGDIKSIYGLYGISMSSFNGIVVQSFAKSGMVAELHLYDNSITEIANTVIRLTNVNLTSVSGMSVSYDSTPSPISLNLQFIADELQYIKNEDSLLENPKFTIVTNTYELNTEESLRSIYLPEVNTVTPITPEYNAKALPAAQLDPLVIAAAEKYNVDPAFVRAVIQQESRGIPTASSPVGAEGLMQIMPATATDLGLNPNERTDPAKNIEAGTKYLAQLLKRYDGNKELALAAYNTGMGNVDKYNKTIPPFAETQDYVKKVLGYEAHYETQYDTTTTGVRPIPTSEGDAKSSNTAPPTSEGDATVDKNNSGFKPIEFMKDGYPYRKEFADQEPFMNNKSMTSEEMNRALIQEQPKPVKR